MQVWSVKCIFETSLSTPSVSFADSALKAEAFIAK